MVLAVQIGLEATAKSTLFSTRHPSKATNDSPIEPPSATVSRCTRAARRGFVVVPVVSAERVSVVRSQRIRGVALVAFDPQTIQVLLAIHSVDGCRLQAINRVQCRSLNVSPSWSTETVHLVHRLAFSPFQFLFTRLMAIYGSALFSILFPCQIATRLQVFYSASLPST